MRVVVALGGNALLRRGQAMTAENQRANIRRATGPLTKMALQGHRLVVTHGNGPQIGFLALQNRAADRERLYPLDVLGAESEGMIGYLIEQELNTALPAECPVAALLTQVEVDANDPAFKRPTKPIGPLYEKAEAERLASAQDWTIALEGAKFRRVVPSPLPQRIVELRAIELLVDQGVIVICAGGGGLPVVRAADGSLVGVEAVIDKDRASALLARELDARALLLLTDVPAVFANWEGPLARPIRYASPDTLAAMPFAAGSMAPKVQAACDYVEQTGGIAGIGKLEDAQAILAGQAGTLVRPGSGIMEWGDG